MTIDKIDWSKLKPYATDTRRSFEELCYQLVLLERGPSARIARVDGSGGDGGVEFYLTLPNGDEVGWQSKFFWPDGRLTPGRKKQIKESLQRACIEHPRLVAWMLMTPSNLTKAEQAWFDAELRTATHNKMPVIPGGRGLDLVHVPESKIVAFLAAPKATGLRTLFFGDVELSIAWFQKLAGEAVGQLRRKFLPTLHATTSIDTELEQVLGEAALSTAIQQRLTSLAASLERLADVRSAFDIVVGVDADATAALTAGRLASDVAITSLTSSQERAQAALRALQEKRWRAARDARPLVDVDATDAFRTGWQTLEQLPAEKVNRSALGTHDRRDWRQIMRSVEVWTRDAWGEVESIDDLLAQLTYSAIHVFGAAGQGKTHVSAHQVMARLENGRPAILLLGTRFTSDEPIETQVLKLLHLEKLGWDDFIAALAVCAETYGVRIPIIIDGLNETLRGGSLSPVWQKHLAAACTGLKESTDAVVLVTTCRGTYEEAIWSGPAPAMRLELDASTNYDVSEAIDLYFEEYQIIADPTTSPLEHFQHPIYLRIFCEAFNPDKATPREVSLGEETLFRVFDLFLDACDERARERLKRLPGVRLVAPALQRLGGLLWDRSRRACPMSDAAPVIEGKPLPDINSDSSLIAFFEQEDVLILRDWWGNGEQIAFAYDLMGGYCIARHLIEQQRAVPTTFSTPAVVSKLFGKTFGERHPLADDIVRSLGVLCPTELGKPIHKLVLHRGALYAAIVALFEGDPAHVDAKAVEVVAKLFNAPENRRELVRLCDSVATNPKHPLNAAFLSRALTTLTMPERDSSWTEYVRRNVDSCRRKVRTLEEASQAYVHGSPTLITKQRMLLLAQYVQWVLTSTVRPLRDEATRALYWFGRASPMELLNLTKAALSISDFYVPERLLAAQYGVMMARAWERGPGTFEEALVPIARTVFDLVFARSASFPLVHILARDFAQNTVRRALVENPSLLTAAQRKLLVSPFPSIPTREWPVLDDPNE
jgi:hypothetical protein